MRLAGKGGVLGGNGGIPARRIFIFKF